MGNDETLDIEEVPLKEGQDTSFMYKNELCYKKKTYVLVTPKGRELITALTPDAMFSLRRESGEYVEVLRKLHFSAIKETGMGRVISDKARRLNYDLRRLDEILA